MKHRIGFVSNSSSTSFIIAFKVPGEICECCGRKDINIVRTVENSSCGDDEVDRYGAIEVIAELENRIEELKCYNPKEEYVVETQNLIEEIKCKEKEGYEIAEVSISYHNEFLNDEIRKSKSVVILKEEEE